MTNDDISVCACLIGLGIAIGLGFAMFLTNQTDSKWLKKTDVEQHKTVTSANYFVQYSAVRRFPR